MASNIYRQYYYDGTSELKRRLVKQGRKKMSPELRRNFRVIGSVTREMREKLDAIKSQTLTESSIINHALLLWLEKYGDMQFAVQ